MGKKPILWAIDPAHTTLGFSVRHLTIANVRGVFREFAGTLALDENAAINSTVGITIETKSVDTGHAKRDEDLRGETFFDVGRFPNIVFKSTSIEALGQGKYKMHGDLTIREATHPVNFTVDGPTTHVKDFFGKTRCAVSGSFKINRKDYGMTWNRALDAGGAVVGDDVMIQIDAEFIREGDG